MSCRPGRARLSQVTHANHNGQNGHHGTVVHQVFSDLEFPACRWQLIAEAVAYGADNVTLAKLHRLPPRRFVSREEVAAAIDATCRRRKPRPGSGDPDERAAPVARDVGRDGLTRAMRIGVIGAGHLGTTLSRLFALAGHEVSFAGLLVARTTRGVAAFADVAVVAVPFRRYRELPAAELAGKPVVDTTNYLPDLDGPLPYLDDDRVTSSELLQAHLTGARVVKALNAIRWEHVRDHRARPPHARRAIPVSGDDQNAKKAALALVSELGFDAIDVGGLATGGRKHQPGTDVYGVDLTARDLRARLRLPT